MIMQKYTVSFLMMGLLFFSLQAEAADTQHRFQTHGFVAQGLIDVSHSNFVTDEGGLSTRLTEIGLNASYQLTDDLRIAGQAVYLNGGNRYDEGVRLDYLLLDYMAYNQHNWLLDIYVGRFKNNHWLYSNTRDIPFARPSIILPQSVYFDGFRDIAMGGDGIAIKASYSDDTLGELDFNVSSGASKLYRDQQQLLLTQLAQGEIKQDFDHQASVYWRPPFSAWRFGVSLLDSDFSYAAANQDAFADGLFSFQFYTANVMYEGELWELSGEVYQERFATRGFYAPNMLKNQVGQGSYLQARYKWSDKLTTLIRAEKFYVDKNDKNGKQMERLTGIPAYFAYHQDLTVGLSYDITQNIRLQFEHHWFKGTGRLNSIVFPDPQLNDREFWQLAAMQFMVWF
jgi:hypothetical protein